VGRSGASGVIKSNRMDYQRGAEHCGHLTWSFTPLSDERTREEVEYTDKTARSRTVA